MANPIKSESQLPDPVPGVVSIEDWVMEAAEAEAKATKQKIAAIDVDAIKDINELKALVAELIKIILR